MTVSMNNDFMNINLDVHIDKYCNPTLDPL